MSKPRALVIRIGANGDIIVSSVVLPYLKADGLEVHYLTSKAGMEILAHNPNIDRLIPYTADSIPIKKLDLFFEDLGRDYAKVVQLTGSIEQSMLFSFPMKEWYWTNKKRQSICTENYYEKTIKLGGYEPNGLRTGQLYFSPDDIAFGKNFRSKHKNNFIIAWAIAGSSLHKSYAHWHDVARMVLDAIPEALIVAVGSPNDMMVVPEHPRIIKFGDFGFPIMRSFTLAQIANLVIGPETALLNAAGCFDTPKICLLSHSGKHNLTSTWQNDYSMQAGCWASPCHLLHKVSKIWKNFCPIDKTLHAKYGVCIPACAGEGFPPGQVFDQIMKVYRNRK